METGKSSEIAPPECSLAPLTIFAACPLVIETAFLQESFSISKIAKNLMVPNLENIEPVQHAA